MAESIGSNQSFREQMPCRFIMRGDNVSSNPRKCTTGGNSIIGLDSDGDPIADAGKQIAKTQYVFENAYIWSD